MLGPPGAGKGTQAKKLSDALGVPHISTGQLVRDNINNGTELGRTAERYVEAGELVPSDVINALVKDRISQPDATHGFILDGYPRSFDQAEALSRMLAARNTKIDAVLELWVREEELLKRLKGRGRTDDTEDVIRNRMRVYRDETAPLRTYYRKELRTVDGVGSVDDVFARVLRALGR
jgi:adenylate kinase